jgi:PhnB protein
LSNKTRSIITFRFPIAVIFLQDSSRLPSYNRSGEKETSQNIAMNLWHREDLSEALREKEIIMVLKTPPEGYHTITPYLTLREVEALVAFVKDVFGATERLRGNGDAGGLHVELTLGDSMLMIGGGPTLQESMTAMLHVYVQEVDAVYQRALQSGASSLMPPTERSHGDRMAGVQDPFGNQWYLATPLANVS